MLFGLFERRPSLESESGEAHLSPENGPGESVQPEPAIDLQSEQALASPAEVNTPEIPMPQVKVESAAEMEPTFQTISPGSEFARRALQRES